MFDRLLIRHLPSAMLAVAIVTSFVPAANANVITYTLTSVPNATSIVFPDYLNPSLMDTITGTITVSSSQSIFGTWNSGNLPSAAITLTYDFSMSNSVDAVTNITGSEDLTTSINNNWIQGGGLTVTASGIYMPNPNISGGEVLMQDLAGAIPPYPLVVLNWNGNFSAFAKHNNLTGPDLQILALPSGSPSVDSLYGSGATWQIATATVPETSTLVLASVPVIGLAIASLRKANRTTMQN